MTPIDGQLVALEENPNPDPEMLRKIREWADCIIIDKRTGKQACSGVWNRSLAEAKIREFKERQTKGGRPDLSKEDVDSLEIKQKDNK